MPNPLPGTVIPSGSLVSPGGMQGVQGMTGATGATGAVGNPLGPVIFQNVAYNLTAADSFKYFVCAGGSWNLGLPAPAVGLCYYVRNDQGITGTTGIITLLPSASATIDGQASLPLLAGQDCIIMTDGSQWRTWGRRREVVIGSVLFTNVATASFLLPDGYTEFELSFDELMAATTMANVQAQLSSDHGNTWLTGTLYYGTYGFLSSATAWSQSGYSSGTFWYMTHYVRASFNQHLAHYTLHPGNANQSPEFVGQSSTYNDTGNFPSQFVITGFYGTNVAVNAIKLNMSSGNIARLNVLVKGRVAV